MALSDVLAASQAFPTTLVSTSAGTLPLRAVMVALAGVENPNWGNQAGDRIGAHYVLADGTSGTIAYTPWNCNGYTAWGTWQISLPTWHELVTQLAGSTVTDPCAMAQWLSDYTHNAQTAAHIVGNGDGLSNWSSYTHSNEWKQYISQGMQAVPTATPGLMVAPPVSGQSGILFQPSQPTQPLGSQPTQPLGAPPTFTIPSLQAPTLFGLKPTTLLGLGLAAVGVGYLFSR